MELDSSSVPALHHWLAQDVPSHWPQLIRSNNDVLARFKPFILGSRREESRPKVTLNGEFSPNVVHDTGDRWTVNGQSGTATPLPRKLG